jgi:hypothetical protein
MQYVREQQGVSWGQWLSFVHFAPASAVPAKAAAATAAESRPRTMARVCSQRPYVV